jgi:hypothetical protein
LPPNPPLATYNVQRDGVTPKGFYRSYSVPSPFPSSPVEASLSPKNQSRLTTKFKNPCSLRTIGIVFHTFSTDRASCICHLSQWKRIPEDKLHARGGYVDGRQVMPAVSSLENPRTRKLQSTKGYKNENNLGTDNSLTALGGKRPVYFTEVVWWGEVSVDGTGTLNSAGSQKSQLRLSTKSPQFFRTTSSDGRGRSI